MVRPPPLSLLAPGALTPKGHRVTIADENVERLDLTDKPDLVGITVKADAALRSWEIATACPEDNAPHADAEAGGLRPVYRERRSR